MSIASRKRSGHGSGKVCWSGPALVVCHSFMLSALLADIEHGDLKAMTRCFPKLINTDAII